MLENNHTFEKLLLQDIHPKPTFEVINIFLRFSCVKSKYRKLPRYLTKEETGGAGMKFLNLNTTLKT